MTPPSTRCSLFMAIINHMIYKFITFILYFDIMNIITKDKGLAAHITLPVWSGIHFISSFAFNHPFQVLGHLMIIQH